MKKIFISHSHFDRNFAYEVINFLEAIGIPSENIFCSSAHGYGVPLGDDFLGVIKKWLEDDVVVIFLLSQHYYQSPVSLCEMGASWISAKKVFPIIIPPLNFSDFKGVFPTTIAFMINESIKWIVMFVKVPDAVFVCVSTIQSKLGSFCKKESGHPHQNSVIFVIWVYKSIFPQ